MKLTIKSYNKNEHYSCAVDENGKDHTVDMLVNGDFPEGTIAESLIGNTYEVEYVISHRELAMNVNPVPIQ